MGALLLPALAASRVVEEGQSSTTLRWTHPWPRAAQPMELRSSCPSVASLRLSVLCGRCSPCTLGLTSPRLCLFSSVTWVCMVVVFHPLVGWHLAASRTPCRRSPDKARRQTWCSELHQPCCADRGSSTGDVPVPRLTDVRRVGGLPVCLHRSTQVQPLAPASICSICKGQEEERALPLPPGSTDFSLDFFFPSTHQHQPLSANTSDFAARLCSYKCAQLSCPKLFVCSLAFF